MYSGQRILIFLIFLVLICVLLLPFFLHDLPRPEQSNQTKNDSYDKTNGLDIKPSPYSSTTNIISDTPSSPLVHISEADQKCINVAVRDALGNPIDVGWIDCAEKKYTFKRGIGKIEFVPDIPFPITINSDGYQSETYVVDSEQKSTIDATLEYLCSFDVYVYSKSTEIPVSGAMVKLWKGPSVNRPIHRTSRLPFLGLNRVHSWAELKLLPDCIQVQGTNISSSSFLPRTGDIVASISDCRWFSDQTMAAQKNSYFIPYDQDKSRQLRIWDTLSFLDLSMFNTSFDQLQLKREQKYYTHLVSKPRIDCSSNPIDSKITDSNGYCSFESLIPGAYNIQATAPNRLSEIVTITPCQKGIRLYLSDSGTVCVKAKRKAHSSINGYLKDIEVVLKSLNIFSPGIYAANTDDLGRANFAELPWGDYEVIAIANTDGFQSTQTLLIKVNQSYQVVEIEFEGLGYSISGVVLEEKQRVPIPDFKIELLKVDSPKTGLWGNVKTDNNGRFEFSELIPGRYIIRPIFIDSAPILYYPSSGITTATGRSSGIPTENLIIKGLEIQLNRNNVDGIEFIVQKTIQTNFSGIVTDSQGKIVKGAKISLKVYQMCEANPITDSNGHFHFSIYSVPVEHPVQLNVYAELFSSNYSNTDSSLFPISQGSSLVKFEAGANVSDIHIKLDPLDQGYSIIGSITTEDGEEYPDLRIFADGHGKTIIGNIEEDGSYHINGLRDGQWTVITQGTDLSIDHPIYGKQGYNKYCMSYNQLELKGENKIKTLDIILQNSGIIAGKLVDQRQQPVQGIKITAKDPKSWREGACKTNRYGLFWISNLEESIPYTLSLSTSTNSPPIVVMDSVIPTDENVIILFPQEQE